MIFSYVQEHAKSKPYKLFIKDPNRELSYQNFLKESNYISNFLLEFGLLPGDRLIISFSNSIELIIAYCGCTIAGIVPCFVSPDISPKNLEYVIEETKAKFIFSNIPLINNNPRVIQFPNINNTNDKDVCIISFKTKNIIMFTSGTTGKPKGVVISEDNIIFTSKAMIEWGRFRNDERELIGLNLSHSFALGQFHSSAIVGASIYIMPNINKFAFFLESIKKYNINGISLTPGLVSLLVSKHSDWIYVNILDTKKLSRFRNGIHSWSVLYLAKPVK